MTANPIDLVGGLTTTANVPKADITGWVKSRVLQVVAHASINDFTAGAVTYAAITTAKPAYP